MKKIRSLKIADAISQERLWDYLLHIAQYGATAKGGVNRQALSREDAAARTDVLRWSADRGYRTFQDEIGNLFVRREGKDPSLAPVMTGSHLDSQPTGGKFDGAYGVVAGLEVLAALDDLDLETLRPIEVVAWTNEEGSRYSPGAMGSSIFAGARELSSVLKLVDKDGIVLQHALEDTLKATPAIHRSLQPRHPVHRYIEAHIEQGPILEEAGLPVGIVTGIQGISRFLIDVKGEEAHAGTTPRRLRRDALASAMAIIAELQRITKDEDDLVRFTVGRLEVLPGSPNTVPGKVRFTIDLRNSDATVLKAISEKIHQIAPTLAPPCTATVTDVAYVAPTTFAADMIDIIRQSAETAGHPHMAISSGAGHDAMYMNRVCPSAMIFVPCLRGVSHNEDESATPEDLAAGARVLASAVVSLAQQ